MENRNYRKKILDTLIDLAPTIEDPTTIDFKMLAKHAGLTIPIVTAEFKDMAALFYAASVRRLKEHEERSKKISKLPNEYALSTLVRHDLTLIFRFARYSQKITAGHAIQLARNYIENTMPNYYFDILRFNPSLLPSSDINAKLYSNFIVHSMFFFTKKELYTLHPDPKELQDITRIIITQLFSGARKETKFETTN
jgi:hypothetical protein